MVKNYFYHPLPSLSYIKIKIYISLEINGEKNWLWGISQGKYSDTKKKSVVDDPFAYNKKYQHEKLNGLILNTLGIQI